MFYEQTSVASEVCFLDSTWGKKGLGLVVCEVDGRMFCYVRFQDFDTKSMITEFQKDF